MDNISYLPHQQPILILETALLRGWLLIQNLQFFSDYLCSIFWLRTGTAFCKVSAGSSILCFFPLCVCTCVCNVCGYVMVWYLCIESQAWLFSLAAYVTSSGLAVWCSSKPVYWSWSEQGSTSICYSGNLTFPSEMNPRPAILGTEPILWFHLQCAGLFVGEVFTLGVTSAVSSWQGLFHSGTVTLQA